MRIITGKYKGRVLKPVKDAGVRPAMDLVRGSIYNMLQNRLALGGVRVLDLFAGTGSLGFEALSRGAAQVVFVDDNPRTLDVIEANAVMLGCLDQCEILDDDALAFIGRWGPGEPFALIFADPPYAYERTGEIPRMIFERQLLQKDGFLIIEHAGRTVFEASALYTLDVQKSFGTTRLSFFRYPA